jgi:hypothetical protein
LGKFPTEPGRLIRPAPEGGIVRDSNWT